MGRNTSMASASDAMNEVVKEIAPGTRIISLKTIISPVIMATTTAV